MNPVLELVEMPNGEICLRRPGEGEPLVCIRFSDESSNYLGGSRIEVARAMIQAGMEAAENVVEGEQVGSEEFTTVSQTVH
ncbi:MAG: hypothetical protein EP312_06570 [Gammaproteobacteria bacterium]|nr:MAG: hypothetical protein EP312_06570 [Gammaproteobacteria bacterium]